MATRREPRDMIRWQRLKPRQQEQLGLLFAGSLSHQKTFRRIRREDGDAMPLILRAAELWEEVKATRRRGVQAFREAFVLATGQTLAGEPLERDGDDNTRVNLLIWYDHLHNVKPLLDVPDDQYTPRPSRLVLFDVWKKPLVWPNVKAVDSAARELVVRSLKTDSDRYVRQRMRKGENRYCEALMADLMAHFSKEQETAVPRSRIQLRLRDAAFSLERDFPDLVFPVKV